MKNMALKWYPSRGKNAGGFTLIEMMIVVAVIGVLMAIAMPAYQDYVTRSKLTPPQNALSTLRVQMEQYFQDNRTYASLTSPIGTDPCSATPIAGVNTSLATSSFTIACDARDATTFTLSATGSSSMAGFVFKITEAGTRTTTGTKTGWAGSLTLPTSCWLVRKGAC